MDKTILITTLCWMLALAGCITGPKKPGPTVSAFPADEVATRVFFIGDAGNPSPGGEPVLQALRSQLSGSPAENWVVFLGDNLDPHGLPPSSSSAHAAATARINRVIGAFHPQPCQRIFIPGNHDWDHGRAGLTRLARYISRHHNLGTLWMPSPGNPGPAIIDAGRQLRLVILDTEWLLRHAADPDEATAEKRSTCYDDTEKAIARAGKRRVIVVAHHPLLSGGQHGGYFTWVDHLFPLRECHPWLWIPLPLVGSLVPLSRQCGVYRQDQSHPANRRLRAQLAQTFARHPPLAYVSGHEASLEVLTGETVPYCLVSGGGTAGGVKPTHHRQETLFAAGAPGFLRLDIHLDGRFRLGVFVVNRSGEAEEYFSRYLTDRENRT